MHPTPISNTVSYAYCRAIVLYLRQVLSIQDEKEEAVSSTVVSFNHSNKQYHTTVHKIHKTYIVHIGIVGRTFQVFTFNESFYTTLNDTRIGFEKCQLRQDFTNELLMLQRLACLHDSHNGRFNGNRTILFHLASIVRRIERCHGNAQFAHVAGKLGIGGKGIRRVDFVASGRLGNDLVLSTRQGMHERLENGFFQVETSCRVR